MWPLKRRPPLITERTNTRYACPECRDDVTAQVWRKALYQGGLPRGYDIIAICRNGHYALYYPDWVPEVGDEQRT